LEIYLRNKNNSQAMVLDLPKMIKLFKKLLLHVHSVSDLIALILAFFIIAGIVIVFLLYYYTHRFVMLPPSWKFMKRDRK
jgi:hypothetical protein